MTKNKGKKGIIIIVILLLILIGTVGFILINVKNIDLKQFFNFNQQIDYDKVIESFAYKGEEKERLEFGDYVSVIYEYDEVKTNHLIDAKNKTEINIEDLIIDKEGYNNKIKELLLLKYPKTIVNKLISKCSSKTYMYKDYIYIEYKYTKNIIDSTREFNLKAGYNDISSYLSVNLTSDFVKEDAYSLYDPKKTTFVLTFDDGPNGEYTEHLIDTLEDYKMSATFFVIANKLSSEKETVKKVYNSHSEIGYHSLNHAYYTKQSVETIQSEFKKADDIFYDITGGHFKYTRPPYGSYNNTVLNALDLSFFYWSIDTNDWKHKDSDYLARYIKANYADGAVVLMHDIHPTTIEAIDKVVEYLFLKDVQVLSISEYATLRGKELENNKIYFNLK